MSAVAAAIVGGAVIGGVASNMAAGKAADAQVEAADKSNQTQLQMYEQTRQDQAPWRAAGTEALGTMRDFVRGDRGFTMSDFKADPGYSFRMSEGQKALERSAAARGGLMSGRTMKDLLRFGQDTASAEFGNAYNRWNNDRTQRFNRLASLAGVGQTANSQIGAMGQNVANMVSQTQQAVGNANASAYIAQGNAINNAIGQGVNGYLQYNMMNRMFPQQAAPAPAPAAPTQSVPIA